MKNRQVSEGKEVLPRTKPGNWGCFYVLVRPEGPSVSLPTGVIGQGGGANFGPFTASVYNPAVQLKRNSTQNHR